MFARLWWKEWRGFGPIWLILAVVAVLLQWMFVSLNDPDIKSGALTPLALAWAFLYAFAVGSAAFAGERESSTLGFLDALPVPRVTLWLGKSSFALITTFVLALGLMLLASLGTQKRDWNAYGYNRLGWEFATLLFQGVAWGLFWSSILRNPLAAGVLSVSSLGLILSLSNLFDLDSRINPAGNRLYSPELIAPESLPLQWSLAMLAWLASGVVMVGLPAVLVRKRSIVVPVVAWRPALSLPATSATRSLLWETWREGRTTWFLVMGIGLFQPILANMLGARQEVLTSIGLATLAALAAGVSVFGPENAAGTRRFLLHQGASPGQIWGHKLLLWGLGMTAFVVVLVVMTNSSLAGVRSASPAERDQVSLILAGIVLDAFAVGVLSAMAIRRRITAALVGVLGLIALVPLQVGLAVQGMIPAWSLLISPLILLAVSRAWANDWLADREGARPWVKLGALLALPFALLISGYIAYRAWGVADIGPLERSMATAPLSLDQDAGPLYRKAVAEVAMRSGLKPNFPLLAIVMAEVIDQGWSPRPVQNLDVREFWETNQKVIEQARLASTLPGVTPPTMETLFGFTSSSTTADMRKLAEFLAVDARERQSRGDLAGMWEDILAQFRMVRQIVKTSTAISDFLIAAQIHQQSVGLAIAWAREPKQTLESLKKARADLDAIPPIGNLGLALRAESRILDNTMAMSSDDIDRLISSETEAKNQSILGRVVTRFLVTPAWERERTKRIGRRLMTAQIPEVDREPYQRPPTFGGQRPSDELASCPLAQQLIPATEAFANRIDIQLAYRRLLDQMLALRCWQVSHDGQYPETLQALVPAELAKLPVDPYTGRSFSYVRTGEEGYLKPMTGIDFKRSQSSSPTRPGQWLLYSVGPDRQDEGGRMSAIPDLGLQGRGDLVIPLP